MRLRAADARRILSFCLDRPFDVELSDHGPGCAIRISPLSESGGPVRVFEADTFEESLRQAAAAGLVRKECIERQIAFYTANGERTFDAKAGQWSGPAFPPRLTWWRSRPRRAPSCPWPTTGAWRSSATRSGGSSASRSAPPGRRAWNRPSTS